MKTLVKKKNRVDGNDPVNTVYRSETTISVLGQTTDRDRLDRFSVKNGFIVTTLKVCTHRVVRNVSGEARPLDEGRQP